MKRIFSGAVLLLGLLVGLSVQAATPGSLMDQFLQDYRLAFEEGNPFRLTPYDEQMEVFRPLIHTQRFDHLRRSRVELRNRDTLALRPADGLYTLTFLKVEEDLHNDGLFTRGLTRVAVEVQIADDRLKVLAHTVLAPDGAPAEYRSTDPQTWGSEHSRVERELYSGLELLREGDLKEAEERVGEAVALIEQGNLPEMLMGHSYFVATAYYFSAMLSVKAGRFDSAVIELEKALALHPEFPVALNLRAEILLGEAEYEKAVGLWRQSLDLMPDQPVVHEVMSLVSEALQAPRKQRDLLLSLINLPPSQAVQVLGPAVKARPRDPLLVAMLAKAYMTSRDPEKGLEVLESSKLVGRDLEVTYLAARIRLKLGQETAALDLFEKVWQKEPGWRDSLVFLVTLHGSLGNYQEAVARLTTYAQSKGYTPSLHALLGKYNLLAGRFLEAISHIESATRGRLPSRIRIETAALMRRIAQQRR